MCDTVPYPASLGIGYWQTLTRLALTFSYNRIGAQCLATLWDFSQSISLGFSPVSSLGMGPY